MDIENEKITQLPVEDVPEFTPIAAAAMVQFVLRAPLQNMEEATAVRNLLDRFALWYEYVNDVPIEDGSSGDK